MFFKYFSKSLNLFVYRITGEQLGVAMGMGGASKKQTSERSYTNSRVGTYITEILYRQQSRYRHQRDIILTDGAGTDIRKILYKQTEQVQTSERYYTNRRSRYRYHRDIIQIEE